MKQITKIRPSATRDLAILRFLRSCAVKLRAGLSPRKALAALAAETRLRWLHDTAVELESQVAQGCPLSLALRGRGDLFPEGVIGFIEPAERRGALGDGLDLAGQFLEGKIQSARAYARAVVRPLHVLSFFFVALYLSVVVMSFLAEGYLAKGRATDARSGIELIALSFADAFLRVSPYVGGVGAFGFLALHLAPRIAWVRRRLERFALRTPVLARILRAQARARFAHTAALGHGLGLSWAEIVSLAASGVHFALVGRSFAQSAEKLRRGRPWEEVLVEDGFLRRRDLPAALAAHRRGDARTFWREQAEGDEAEATRGLRLWRVAADMVSVLVIALLVGAVALTLYVPLFVLR